MQPPTLDQVLDRYGADLKLPQGKRTKTTLTQQGVLALLLLHDQVQRQVGEAGGLSVVQAQRLVELDDQLRRQASRLLRVVGERQLVRWRLTLNPEEKAWWWLERMAGEHPLNRLNGLWRLLMVVGWAASITLIVNLAVRFLGVGWWRSLLP
jgi:hypothetical protein